MQRTLEPELLDGLPPDHPDALHNRRDLRLTNIFMRNYAWFARILPGLLQPGEVALEIGAGTGELGARLARCGVAVDGLDLWPRPAAWPAARCWHQTDLRTFADWARYPVVFGNLIFHQFSGPELATLGRQLSGARVVIASEPLRRRASQWLYRAAGPLFGANHVSLHDAHVSIAAGFRRDELPRALGLARSRWRADCRSTWIGAYRMIACRERG